LWRYVDCLRRQQCGALFNIKACIHEFLVVADLADTGVEYIATAAPVGFSPSNKPYSERVAEYEWGCNR
jgi:hypothetical protein